MKPSKSLKKSFGGLDAEATAGLVAAASDIAIVIDKKGIIRDFACDSGVISGASPEEWIGKPWQDTVTIESRPKVEAMLAEASSGVPARITTSASPRACLRLRLWNCGWLIGSMPRPMPFV